METTFQTKRIATKIHSSYEHFTTQLESTVKKIEQHDFKDLATDPEKTKAHLENLAGKENLTILSSRPHGALLKLAGIHSKAVIYEIGNPLLVLKMTGLDIRVALYAPIRVLVYQAADGQVFVEYDLPSATMAQFQNEQINEVAALLDIKFEELIRKIDRTH